MAKAESFSENTALRIAYCESRFKTYAKNKHSSASGLYQFTSATWRNYCSGEVFDKVDNISCFLDLYAKHPSWWECQ